MRTHLDLFSGIGGFAYAIDQVWDDVEHIFCDNDKFCRQVLKKHWPESEIYNDIRDITDTNFKRSLERWSKIQPTKRNKALAGSSLGTDILTGGFPCQPFSAAGVRRGTSDERYLWPEMLRVIRLTKPTWVIAENVRGILTIENGLVFEQVCSDLETSGYSVQPFIIPAVAVNASHRRDRVWFVATKHTKCRHGRGKSASERASEILEPANKRDASNTRCQHGESGSSHEHEQATSQRSSETAEIERHSADDSNPKRQGRQRSIRKTSGQHRLSSRSRSYEEPDWSQDWSEIATRLCSVDDGLPAEMGDFTLTKAQHRKEQLKAYGNAIVPQVAIEILKGIKEAGEL